MQRIAWVFAAAAAAGCGLAVSPPAGGTALAPFIDLQEAGLAVDADGSGYAGSPVDLDVNVGGSVRFALLYWMGESPDAAATQPHRDQEVVFGATPVTGTIIGTEETGDGPATSIGYFADVTSLVSAAGTGPQSFSFADGNAGSNLTALHGAALFVAYTDAADSNIYRVLVHDGIDYAHGPSADAENAEALEAVFNHGSHASARTAELYVLAGNGTAVGGDSVLVDNNAAIIGQLNASDGDHLDMDTHSILIPGGVASTGMEVFSPNAAGADALLWEMAALRVNIVPEPATAALLTLAMVGVRRRRK